MKFLILDVYCKTNARVSKDTAGGYGTVNEFGAGIIPHLLTKLKARAVDYPPLYSAYCAAVIRNAGHEVAYRKLHLDEVKDIHNSEFDILLITSSMVAHESEIEAIRFLRTLGLPVGTIGPFAQVLPAPYIKAGAFVICGEPEFFLQERSNHLESLRFESGLVRGRLDFGDVNDLPWPAWDLIMKAKIPRYQLIGNGHNFLPILATRGCPYSCSYYCTYPTQQGKKIRARNPVDIHEEMIHWYDNYGVDFFVFRDPVFSIDRRHTEELCDLLIRDNRAYKFVVETHLRNIDKDLGTKLKQAGAIMVKVGIESPIRNVLDTIRRQSIKDHQELSIIKMLEEIGIKVVCYYILAMPDDSFETCEDTIKYAMSINSYGAQFSVFTPYPGTSAFKEFGNIITTPKYEDFTQWKLVFQHKNLSNLEVQKLIKRAYTLYYTNPHWIMKHFLVLVGSMVVLLKKYVQKYKTSTTSSNTARVE